MLTRFILPYALMAIAAPASAANQRDLADCRSFDMDRRVIGCSHISADSSETDHDRAVASHKLGVAYIIKGERRRAIARFSEAVRFDPNLSRSYDLRGSVHAVEGRYDEAIADYTQAIQIKPSFTDAYNDRARAHFDRGDLDLAIADYDISIQLDPESAIAHFGRGMVKLKKGDVRGGNADIRVAKTRQPDIADSFGH